MMPFQPIILLAAHNVTERASESPAHNVTLRASEREA